ncbi:hypothetical protein PybrP1_012152 [[Pythium] brassicae (nom. inval.)]|nr:hypothetical protein PybrP1_012152 [[Pythium] brassicae (nom. inval.)]
MEINAVGDCRVGDGAPRPARGSALGVGVLRLGEGGLLLTRPPPARSLNSVSAGDANARGDRVIAGGQRASEPLLLDFDLPSPGHKHVAKTSDTTSNGCEAGAPATRPKRKSMPRLDSLLPPVRITEEQKAGLKQAAEERIASMLTRCQAAWDGTHGIFEDPKVWKMHSSKPNLVVYRRRSKSAAQYHPFVATGRVPGITLQDIISPRDNAFMQYTKTVTNKLGEKILVKVVESLPESIVPLLPDQGSLRFVRSELSLIYIVVANVNLSLFVPVIVNLDSIADAKFITKHGLIFPHDTAGAGKMSIALSRKACYVCFKSFGMLRRHRHHCRMCGEFDAAENTHFPLQNQPVKKKLEDSNRHGFPVVNLFKFCKKCIFMMQAAFAGRYYSRRIEKLRQEHMEREKQKLRDQHRSALAMVHGDRTSVQLFDESDFSSSESSSRKMTLPSSDDASFDFDGLVLTDAATLRGLAENNHCSTNGAKDSTVNSVAAAPSAAPLRRNTSSGDNQSDEPLVAALQPVEERQRSVSIPEQLERMERSIAEQEVLLSSIKEERAKPGAAPRLPIGAVMRSMALSSTLQPVTGNQLEEGKDGGDAAATAPHTADT